MLDREEPAATRDTRHLTLERAELDLLDATARAAAEVMMMLGLAAGEPDAALAGLDPVHAGERADADEQVERPEDGRPSGPFKLLHKVLRGEGPRSRERGRDDRSPWGGRAGALPAELGEDPGGL